MCESPALRTGPHPRLGKAARQEIELDYDMQQGEVAIEVRVSLSFYLDRRLGLGFEPDSVQPERQQIVLLNREEVAEKKNC